MMKGKQLPEVWLRGPLAGIPPLLQPVAHALLQAREEVLALMEDFPDEKLWIRPAGLASPGFHLQHLTGVLDRLLTYARGEMLTAEQLEALSGEGKSGDERPGSDVAAGSGTVGNTATGNVATRELLERFRLQVDRALEQIGSTPEDILTEVRGVGRAQVPSTVIGLLVHAAEHTQRHNGQLLVTAKVILAQATP